MTATRRAYWLRAGAKMAIVGLFLTMIPIAVAAADGEAGPLVVGRRPPLVRLAGDSGGRLDGAPWSSAELAGKTFVLFYVDPDCKDRNEHVAEAIRARRYPDRKFGSVAVVNLAATWKPKWIVRAILRRKQKKYPRTVYVIDKDKTLVRKWGLADQDYVILAFDPDGRLLFRKAGKFRPEDVRNLLDILDRSVNAESDSGRE